MKPKMFVGSSTEGLSIAYAIQEELEFDAEITVWPQDIFSPRYNAIESLQSALLMFDYAAFVMSPDDHLTSRGESQPTPRDNVIFELGLFIGRLGRDRVFFIVPRSTPKLHLPSDLLGIQSLTFNPDRSDGNLRASVGPACNQMRQAFAESVRDVQERKVINIHSQEHEPSIAIKAAIENAASRTRETRLAVSAVLFADIDGFSAINKWFGAEVSDQVILTVEALFTGAVRKQFYTRFGGDQFVACISAPTKEQIMRFGKDLAQSVAGQHWSSIAPGLYVTISIGLATSVYGESVTDWVVRAIHGSILAKKDGGNRVAEAPVKLGRAVSRAWSDYAS